MGDKYGFLGRASPLQTSRCESPIGIAGRKGEARATYGRTARVSRSQLRAWRPITDIAQPSGTDADRAGGAGRRTPAQRAELGDRRILPQGRDAPAPDRRLPTPPCLYPRE